LVVSTWPRSHTDVLDTWLINAMEKKKTRLLALFLFQITGEEKKTFDFKHQKI
jgi:hypothetical protein